MEYFSIYPFTQEREDERTAKLIVSILNSSLKTKRISRVETFIPEYVKQDKAISSFVPKSLEQQRLEFAIFREKLRSKSPKSVKRKTV